MVKAINQLRPKFTTNADGSDAVLFITELVGEEDGPTIGISASIHGNENTGSQAILDLYRQLKDMPLKGRILLLPVANPSAFAVNERYATIDKVDLNRQFPGNPNGTYSQQLAHAITNEFLNVIDVHIDLHSGTDRPTVDYVYIWNDERLSRAFGSKVLYRPVENKQGTVFGGTTKTVTIDTRNIPVAVIELGGGIVDQTGYVKQTVDGVLNMLKTTGTIAGEPWENPKQVVVSELAGVRPTQGGFIETLAPANGEVINGGELLGRVVSPYTFEVLEEIKTPFENGIMIMQHLTRNVVQSGDYAYMIGNLDGATD
ncbi:succinylglutamate desuccinylase/aspartoacylase family protein [Devosia sp. WQ 349]|uniref:succinylglutamate desuccinylase/aspartoacylase family protein n=1 Tax=Devosia sp. WQ 349K1 TaxID=2800329 RepID=UPI0019087DA0|nr:succinylglutamate desuccinylase/aspartoacylase family protein [Devosia sp. WQ 349K1]MBK1794092.1 succinylglutamate desuccinylase/aspartoacylase family protein [Devosia sp. WQ 349K1]